MRYEITPEHRAQLKPWADKWIANAMSTKPMDDEDRAAMRVAIRGLYQAAGLKPPPDERIVFVPSPFVARVAGGFAAAIWHMRKTGQPAATEAATWDATEAATWDATRAATEAATRAAENWWEFGDIRAMARMLGSAAEFGIQCAFSTYRMWQGGNQWPGGDAFFSFFRHVAKLQIDYGKWSHWESASLHGGPRIMHEEFCIVSDRPRVLLVDAQNRPHCEDGPFCRWSDGAALYCLNGVRVPKWLVMTRAADLDPARLLKIDNAEVRREFVRKVGVERIVSALSGGAISKTSYRTEDGREHHYELHRLAVSETERWTYLSMINPSVGLTHFEGVPNECHTVRDALIFRAGLTPAQIDDTNGAEWHQQGDVILRPHGATTFRLFPSSLS